MLNRLINRTSAQPGARNVLRQQLIDALQHPGCVLCQLAQDKSQRYIETLLDTAVIDVDQRNDWQHAKGFCAWHAHMALTLPQGSSSLAILYADILRHEMAQMTPLSRSEPMSCWRFGRSRRALRQRAQNWLRAWRQPRVCPTCRLWQEQEQLCLSVLLDHWLDPELVQAFAQSDGLCVPHTARLIAQGSHHARLPAILAAQQERMQALHDDLREFIRKQDYRFAHEPFGREANAWQRVVALIVGASPRSS
jgi:Family of unknown function (DUF6062)